jgi:hypothetical protein
MKVRIRKYPTWFGPHQLIDAIFFWAKDEDWVYNVGKWYSDTWLGNLHYKLADHYMQWKESRRVKVELDRWDTWSMDHTLAEIVLPMLIQLKQTKHGAPAVDQEDVPENLRAGKLEIEQYEKDGTTDALFFKRWDWVVDEMIFAFNSKLEDWEDQFHSGEHDILWEPVEHNGEKMYEMKRGPKDTHKWDREGHQVYQDRINNGFRLFGKYYNALWD